MRRSSRISIAIAIFSLLVLAAPRAAHADDYSYARVVSVNLVEGDVEFSRLGQQDWQKALLNQPIRQGDSVATTNGGRVEIEFENGATARLAENSILQFTELALAGGERITRLTLSQGTATFYVNPTTRDTFQVLTPQVQISADGNSHFRVDVFSDGSSVSVFKGRADVDSPAGTEELEKGQTLAYSTTAGDPLRLERNPPADAWDKWVANRDDAINSFQPASLRYPAWPPAWDDFSLLGGPYGCGYGYGYSLFPSGAWQFYPGIGWSWVSYFSFGGAPYYLGPWGLQPIFGWGVPISYFGYGNSWCPGAGYAIQPGYGYTWVPLVPSHPVSNPLYRPPTSTWVGGRKGGPNEFLKPIVGDRPPSPLGSGGEPLPVFGPRARDFGDAHPSTFASRRPVGSPVSPTPFGFRKGPVLTPPGMPPVPTAPAPLTNREIPPGISFDPADRVFINSNVPPHPRNEAKNGPTPPTAGVVHKPEAPVNGPTKPAPPQPVKPNVTVHPPTPHVVPPTVTTPHVSPPVVHPSSMPHFEPPRPAPPPPSTPHPR